MHFQTSAAGILKYMEMTNYCQTQTKNINGILLSIKHEQIETDLFFTEVTQLSPKISNNLIISGVYESIEAAEEEINDSLIYLLPENTVSKRCTVNSQTSCCKIKGTCKNN